jgi:hypothetical protein
MTKTKKRKGVVFPIRPTVPWQDKFISLIENQLWTYIPEPEQSKWEQIKDLMANSANLEEALDRLDNQSKDSSNSNDRLLYSHWRNMLQNVADIRTKIPSQEQAEFYQWLQKDDPNFTWPGLVSYYYLKKQDWEEVADKGTQTDDNLAETNWKQNAKT